MATSASHRRPDPVALALALDRGDRRPLGVQLADAVRAAASSGRLRPGDRLPSTRGMAARLGLSRTVTAAAYEQLLAEGWLESRRGAGTFVAASPGPAPAGPARIAPAPAVVPPSATGPRPRVHGPLGLDFRPGSPWVAGIDVAAWRRAWRAAGRVTPAHHRTVAGRDAYRETVAEHLVRHRGLPVADPLADDGVLATAGTAAAIVELAATVLNRGDAVAVEDPGWPRAAACLRSAGMDVVPAPVDEHGLVPGLIPAGVRAVYCSPSHQYPLGARMPAGRRITLTELARRHGWLLLEDDYDGELRFDLAPPPLLAALAPDVVVHLGTTSKILSPALGSGWMIAPAAVGRRVLERRRTTAPALSEAGQSVLVELAGAGDLSRHLRRVRRELSARRHRLVREAAGFGVVVPGDDAGAHIVLPVPTAADETRLMETAAASGLLVDALARYHLDPSRPERRHGVVLGYTTASEAEPADAIRMLLNGLGR